MHVFAEAPYNKGPGSTLRTGVSRGVGREMFRRQLTLRKYGTRAIRWPREVYPKKQRAGGGTCSVF